MVEVVDANKERVIHSSELAKESDIIVDAAEDGFVSPSWKDKPGSRSKEI